MTKRAAVSLCLVLLSLATALVGAGCGSSGGGDPLAAAATTSTSAAGYRMTFTMNMTSSALPQPISVTGGGALDMTDHAGQFAFDMNIPELRAVMPSTGGSLHMDMILRGTTLYMRLPAAISAHLSAGRPWLKLDLSHNHSGIPGLGALGGSWSEDPSQFLQYLRGLSGGVTKVGTDTVVGVRATHYRATIDLQKALAHLPARTRSAASGLLQMAHVTKLPVDVWVDSDHHVRRLSFTMNLAVSGQSVAMNMQVTIPQYGPQPEPSAPPAGQVTDMSSLTGSSANGVPSA